MALADYADEDGYSWPRVKTVMSVTELSERAVRGALTWLEEEEYLIRQFEYEPAGGRQTTNIYRLTNLSNPPVCQGEGACSAGGGCTTCRGEGAPAAGTTRTPRRNPQKEEENGGPFRPRRQRTKSSFVGREPDDPLADNGEEAPALGASPRKTTEQRKETAARGKTPFALALKMKRELSSAGFSAPVNEKAVTNQMKSWDLPIDTLTVMVDVFLAAPSRYLKGDEVPWIGFVRQREVLKADATKVERASAPASSYAEGL